MDRLINNMKLQAAGVAAEKQPWTIGTVSSYDGKSMAKVKLQPEGTVTGWLPISTLMVGAGFGIGIGPTVGASCLVHFPGGDREAGVIGGFFFTDVETPLEVAEGEMKIKTKSGSTISLLQNGSIALGDKDGGTAVIDGSGNVKLTNKEGVTVNLSETGASIDSGPLSVSIVGQAINISGVGGVHLSSPNVIGIDAPSAVINAHVSGENNLAQELFLPITKFGVLTTNTGNVNQTNLDTAIQAAVNARFSLACPEGVYPKSGYTELGYNNMRFIALGPRVRFLHTGAGPFFGFNGNATSYQVAAACDFGGAYQIYLDGNPGGGTTQLMLVNSLIWSKLRMRGRDANIIFQMTAGAVSGFGSVGSEFEITASPNTDTYSGPYVYSVVPNYGALIEQSYASKYLLHIEACGAGGAPQVQIDNAVRNRFVARSVEGGLNGGTVITSTCHHNVFDTPHNEFNGSAADWIVHGDYNHFRSIASAGTVSRMEVYGSYNRFELCDIWGAIVFPGAVKNFFDTNISMATNGGFSDSGSGTIVHNCDGIADQNWP